MGNLRGLIVAGVAVGVVVLAVIGNKLGIKLDSETLMSAAALIGALTQLLPRLLGEDKTKAKPEETKPPEKEQSE